MQNFKVALQLYSIREDMEKDIAKALKTVKEIGYDYVEFAGYFGHSAEYIRGLLDEIGLECISVHQGYEVFLSNPQKEVDYLKTIGAKYCAVPWMGMEKQAGTPQFKKTISEFIQVGNLLKDSGITLLYHNHDFEFKTFKDKFLLDWLYESVPSNILQTEIDTCWVKYASQDPAEYIKKYIGRSPVVHLKDFMSNKFSAGAVYALIDETGKENETDDKIASAFEFKPLGQGVQDFKSILEAAKIAGTHTVVVEQDQSPNIAPMESAKISRQYLKSLGI
jgi:sugar phosphate isomerase/epimerase